MIDMHVGFTKRELRAERPPGYVDVALRQVEVVGMVLQGRWRTAIRTQLDTWAVLGSVAYRDGRAWLDRQRSR